MTDRESHGQLLLFGDIDLAVAQRVYEFVNDHNGKKKKLSHLELVINSSGGLINQCFAIVDAIQSSHIPIHTTAVGEILSSGLLIFVAGARPHRLLHRNVSIMSHQVSGEISGKIHELLGAQSDWEITHNRMQQHLESCSNLTPQEVQDILLPTHDAYLTPQQLIQCGLADGYK
jgi:ATP-dependent protease ClpP protease subunit